jgi:hypothetical protein
MGHGGARPGSGRKKGLAPEKILLLREKIKKLTITPLDVMLEYMKTCYEAGNFAEAHSAAKDAAPYLRARLSSVDARVDQHTTHHVVDDAFDRLVHELDRLAAAGEADQGATGHESRRTH